MVALGIPRSHRSARSRPLTLKRRGRIRRSVCILRSWCSCGLRLKRRGLVVWLRSSWGVHPPLCDWCFGLAPPYAEAKGAGLYLPCGAVV